MANNTAGILGGLTRSSEGLSFIPGDKAPPFGPNVVIARKNGVLEFAPLQVLNSEALEHGNRTLAAIAVREKVARQLKQMGIHFEHAVEWSPPRTTVALDLAIQPVVEKPVLDRSIEALDLAMPKVSKSKASLFGSTISGSGPAPQPVPKGLQEKEQQIQAERLRGKMGS